MAKLAVLNNANSPIGTPVTIPDSAIAAIAEIVGNGTNAQIADRFLADVVERYRTLIARRREQQARSSGEAATQAAVTAAVESIDTDWAI